MALGLLPNPVTKKADVQLDQAKHAIDLLTMLQQKTEGNRTPEESGELEAALHELRHGVRHRATEVESTPQGDGGVGDFADVPTSSSVCLTFSHRKESMPGPGKNGRAHRASRKNPSLVTCSSSRVTPPWF